MSEDNCYFINSKDTSKYFAMLINFYKIMYS